MADHAERRSAAVALVAAAALAAGCGGTSEPASAEPELAGRIIQSRLDQSLDSIRVQVANEGDEPVRVADVVLHAPPFPDAASEDDAVIPPGQRIDFRAEYGQPTCADPTPTPAVATAAVFADGRPIEIDVEDSHDVLKRLLTQLCGRQQLAAVVDVRLGQQWTGDPSGDALLGTIELRRVDDGAPVVTLERVAGGSVVFELQPVDSSAPQVTLPAGEDHLSVPVRVTAQRCEPHAQAEDKKKYVFPVWLAVAGGREPIDIDLEVDVRAQPAFDSLCDAATTAGVES